MYCIKLAYRYIFHKNVYHATAVLLINIIICPIHRKDDKLECEKLRAITIFNVT